MPRDTYGRRLRRRTEKNGRTDRKNVEARRIRLEDIRDSLRDYSLRILKFDRIDAEDACWNMLLIGDFYSTILLKCIHYVSPQYFFF